MSSLSTSAGSYRPENFNRGNGTLSGLFIRHDQTPPGAESTLGVYYQYGGDAEIYQGRFLDNFHRRKNDGELLPYTEYLKLSHTFSGTGTYDVTVISTGRRLWFDDPRPVLVYAPCNGLTVGPLDECIKLITDQGMEGYDLVQQAASKLYSRGWDGLTFIAELHHVVRMFKGALKNLGKLARNPDELFNAWLEGRYGWRILMYDIQDINKLIEQFDKDQMTRVKERAGYDRQVVIDRSQNIVSGTGFWEYSDIATADIGVRGSIIADFMPSRITINPITTAWELMTLSFVIDWFWNVGRSLEALSFLALNDLYTACIGHHIEIERLSSLVYTNKPTHSGSVTQNTTEKIEYYKRHPVTVPMLPSWNVDLNAFKVMDLISLLFQRFI